MPVPRNVSYDRYADLTVGFLSQSAAVNYVSINGVALVTWWLSNAWGACSDPVSTGWTNCASGVVTGWTSAVTIPSTAWVECENV